nr:hypothetical protein Itr_chr04CG22220 [Ipomoea trifida]
MNSKRVGGEDVEVSADSAEGMEDLRGDLEVADKGLAIRNMRRCQRLRLLQRPGSRPRVIQRPMAEQRHRSAPHAR